MARRLAALLWAALMVAGCSAVQQWTLPTGFVTGTSVHSIDVGGHDRTYRLYMPAGRPASAALVVMMHGYSGSAKQAERGYKWDEVANSAKFVVAYPDGLDRAWNVDGEGCCGGPARQGVDDVAFISAVVADIAKNVGINPAKVYATGMSIGGIMSYTLACSTDIFAAIGPVAGTQLNLCPAPRPTSVMHIHGTADRLVPYQGGRASASSTVHRRQKRIRSGATLIGAATRLSRPTVRSPRRPPGVPTTAASSSSPWTAADTSGPRSRPRRCGNPSPRTRADRYISCAVVEKM